MARTLTLLLSIGLLSGVGCVVGPRTGCGLQLPPGDATRGRLAFEELGCRECHQISGESAGPDAPEGDTFVPLGGPVTRIDTYGELVTSIINPSHEITRRYPREQVADGDISKMDDCNGRMTVAQLIDLTTFLQSQYELREPLLLPDVDE